jgi:hypothetical protein
VITPPQEVTSPLLKVISVHGEMIEEKKGAGQLDDRKRRKLRYLRKYEGENVRR